MLESRGILEGHSDRVWTLAWNPSGTVLASSGADKTIRFWVENKAGSWECTSILTQTHTKSIRRLVWSPCGNFLASASFDSTVCISKRNRIDGAWTTVVNLDGHENEVKSIGWSHDGQYLASCGRDRTIWIWERATNTTELDSEDEEYGDAENWDCSDVKNDHSKDVKHIVWHPHHNILASTSYDDTIKLFHKDGDDWKCFDTLLSHTSTVWSADFSSSGEYLVTCSDDKTVRVWRNHSHEALPSVQANSWKCCSVIQGYHSRPIYDVSWCRMSDLIASASGDNSIAVYKRDTTSSQDEDVFACIHKLSEAHKSDANAVAWNPRTIGLLASGGDDRLVKLWKFSDNDLQGTKQISIVDEIMNDLSKTILEPKSASSQVTDLDSQTEKIPIDPITTLIVNDHSQLFKLIHNLQTLQGEIYEDTEKQQLTKLLDLKLSSNSSLPTVRVSELSFVEDLNLTKGFHVNIVDNSDQIRFKFKVTFRVDNEKFKLALPRRSVKLTTVGTEIFLLEKTGDLYRVTKSGKSEFLLGHLFTFADVQFIIGEEDEQPKYIISADRDEKLRITNYPNTFEIERYCFGHKSLLNRIFIVDQNTFASTDQQGEVCLWDLGNIPKDEQKPLLPIRVILTGDETARKRIRVG